MNFSVLFRATLLSHLDFFEDIPLRFRVGRVFLISDDGGFSQDFHGENRVAIFARYFLHKEDLAVTALAQDASQLEVLGARLFLARVDILLC